MVLLGLEVVRTLLKHALERLHSWVMAVKEKGKAFMCHSMQRVAGGEDESDESGGRAYRQILEESRGKTPRPVKCIQLRSLWEPGHLDEEQLIGA